MNAKGILTTLLLASSFAVAAPASAEPPPLISRDVLFGNPERANPQLSPDGKKLAWIAPDKKNVLQVWVRTVGKNDDKIVTADKKRGIRQYFWAEDAHTLLYMQDTDGDENFHVYGVDLTAGNVRDYTALQGVRAGLDNIVFNTLARSVPQVCKFDLAYMEAASGRRIHHMECIIRGGHVCRFRVGDVKR